MAAAPSVPAPEPTDGQRWSWGVFAGESPVLPAVDVDLTSSIHVPILDIQHLTRDPETGGLQGVRLVQPRAVRRAPAP